MIINFNELHTFWHSDCEGNQGRAAMREVKEDDGCTLLECCVCGAKGFYPHGKSGFISVEAQPQESGSETGDN